MAVTVKKLAQTALSATATVRYTAGTGVTTQVSEIYLVNTGTVERTVTIYQGGTTAAFIICQGVTIPVGGFVMLQDLKIVVSAVQTLAAKQDVGTDVYMTLYGVEEV